MAALNVSKDDLRKMDLGALVRKSIVYDDKETGTRVIEYEFERGTVNKTEWYDAPNFLSAVSEIRNDNQGKRFDSSSALGTKIATIPMWLWAREIAPRSKDGNHSSLKKLLNSDDLKPFRTFEGKI